MNGLGGLLIVVGSCVLLNSALRNRPFGRWFFIGAGFISVGFFLAGVNNG